MKKIVLTTFLVFGLFTSAENIFGQELYKWVDEKGTVHFSDNPTSTVFNQEKERPIENGLEVLKRSETGNRSQATASGGKRIIINYSQSSSAGSSSGGGSTTVIRSSRS
jgi:hypothetical protein